MLNTYPLAKDLQVLVEIVHSGSFSAAAATLGQTPAFVTKHSDPRVHAGDDAAKPLSAWRSAHGEWSTLL